MRLTVGMPCYAGIHPKVVLNLINLDIGAQIARDDLIFDFPQSSILSLNRNEIVRRSRASEADWILMWDSDIEVFKKDFILDLVRTAYEKDAPVVGIPCRLKLQEEAYNFRIKGAYCPLPKEDTEVDVVGTGVMLINAQWLKKNFSCGPWFSFLDTEYGTQPEDWVFCDRVRERGGKIYINPKIQTAHNGQMAFVSHPV